jgi:hypothetical protein
MLIFVLAGTNCKDNNDDDGGNEPPIDTTKTI